jgi:hypothetical protein
MKYVVKVSGTTIYVQNFVKFGSGIQKSMGREEYKDTETRWDSHKPTLEKYDRNSVFFLPNISPVFYNPPIPLSITPLSRPTSTQKSKYYRMIPFTVLCIDTKASLFVLNGCLYSNAAFAPLGLGTCMCLSGLSQLPLTSVRISISNSTV